MTELFDKPQWELKLVRGADIIPTRIAVEFYDEEDRKLGTIGVHPPTGLIAWLVQVPQTAKLSEVVFYMDKSKKRWVFGVSVPTGDYDLWHYTESTLPYWARKVVK